MDKSELFELQLHMLEKYASIITEHEVALRNATRRMEKATAEADSKLTQALSTIEEQEKQAENFAAAAKYIIETGKWTKQLANVEARPHTIDASESSDHQSQSVQRDLNESLLLVQTSYKTFFDKMAVKVTQGESGQQADVPKPLRLGIVGWIYIIGFAVIAGFLVAEILMSPTEFWDPYVYNIPELTGILRVIIVIVIVLASNLFIRYLNTMHKPHYAAFLWALSEFNNAVTRQHDEVRELHLSQKADARIEFEKHQSILNVSFNKKMDQLRTMADNYHANSDLLAPTWNDSTWHRWETSNKLETALRLGRFSLTKASPPLSAPMIYPFPGKRGLLVKPSANTRKQAIEGIQTLMIRLLASIPPGKLRFTFVDPIGRGQNAAHLLPLSDYDPQLVTDRVWTEPRHIEERLSELTEHMETIIQKYLRSEFPTIEDYNEHAGEIEEPYRFLVIFGFPINFNDETCRRLISIAETGPRCGVYTIVLCDPDQKLPYGFNLRDLEGVSVLIEDRDEQFYWRETNREDVPFIFDTMPDKKIIDRVIAQVGQAAKDFSRVEVPFEKIMPKQNLWGAAKADDGFKIPLGPAGAKKIQYLELGHGTEQHVLVVGRTGSGKSTLLHTLITSMALTYEPDEAELYLIDLKKGVEFKTYATHMLPHARVIAIESEREFALSTLEGLNAEMERRGKVFRAHEANSLKEYRAKADDQIPRILLLIDEFQELFIDDDNVARGSQQILDRLVRQGRSFGIHVVLGSQTLAGSYSLTRSTIDQMAVRIALQSTEADSRLILADDNPAARLLTRPGEAIYNSATGLEKGNNRFQVAWLTSEGRDGYLKQILKKWGSNGQRTQIVFEGTSSAQVEQSQALWRLIKSTDSANDILRLRAYLGEPIAIRDAVAAQFRRQSGSNLVIVTRNDEEACGMVASALLSLVAQLPHNLAAKPNPYVFGLDFSPIDTPHGRVLKQVGDLKPNSVKWGRRNQMEEFLSTISREVEQRIESEQSNASPLFLLIFGLHKARDMRHDDEVSFSAFQDEEIFNPTKVFASILRQGPEVGVHTLAWCDTVSNLNRAVDYRVVREFGMRVASYMSDQDSSTLIDTVAAAKLAPHRAIFYDDEENRLEKMRPYLPPSPEWLETVHGVLDGR